MARGREKSMGFEDPASKLNRDRVKGRCPKARHYIWNTHLKSELKLRPPKIGLSATSEVWRLHDRALAVDVFHVGGGVAVAGDLLEGDGGFEFSDILRRKMDVRGGGVFFKIFAAFGAGNGDEVLAFG